MTHIRELEPERIVRLERDAVVVLDQRRLPDEEVELRCGSAAEVAEAIRTLAVRGAPAIGIAAAYGLALAAARGEDLDAASDELARRAADRGQPPLGARRDARRPDRRARARRIHARRGRALPAHGARTRPTLVPAGARVLTHCNAGGLATGGYGSAVGAIRAAWERGLVEHVLGRRDAAAAPGRAADGVRARGSSASRTP